MHKSHEQLTHEINDLFREQDLDTVAGVLFQALIHAYIMYRERGLPMMLRDPIKRLLAYVESNITPDQAARHIAEPQPTAPLPPVDEEDDDLLPPEPPPPIRHLH